MGFGLDRVLAAAAIVGLAWFTIRRLLLLGAALAPRDSLAGFVTERPEVALAISAHNEERVIDGLLASLERLDYPPKKLTTVFARDGCTDATVAAIVAWAADRPSVRIVELPLRLGKAAALNEALALTRGDVFAVLDADLRPREDSLRSLVTAFSNPAVAGAPCSAP